jgi:hypothetical protein
MIRTFIAATLAIGFAGTAMAGPATSFTAKLETPMQTAEKVVAAKVLWNCAADTCVAKVDRKTVNVSTCRKIVKQVGALSEFSNDNGALSAADLTKCNASAK